MNSNHVACSREPLVDAISTVLARDHALGLGDIRVSLTRTIDEAVPAAIRAQGDRQLVMDDIGMAIAALVPPEYRGVYGAAVETDCGLV